MLPGRPCLLKHRRRVARARLRGAVRGCKDPHRPVQPRKRAAGVRLVVPVRSMRTLSTATCGDGSVVYYDNTIAATKAGDEWT